jgi:hypothetical protein
MALAVSFVATHIYYASLGEGGGGVVDEGDAWLLVGGLSGGLGCFFATFLLTMKPNYVATFFATQTGYQYVQSKFLREGDEKKKAVFKYNKKLWLGIREDVKAWTLENWERWEEERPDWFNDAFRASVADSMIPAESLRRMDGGGGTRRRRRRSSIGDLLGGGARVAPAVGGGEEEEGEREGGRLAGRGGGSGGLLPTALTRPAPAAEGLRTGRR